MYCHHHSVDQDTNFSLYRVALIYLRYEKEGKIMKAERKPQLLLSSPGRITKDQGIVKILTPLHHIYLSICFQQVSCQKLRECAQLSVPRITISRVLCLQISKCLLRQRRIIVWHLTVEKIACGLPKVMAEGSHAKKLLSFSVCI